jgi:hypothetical protein
MRIIERNVPVSLFHHLDLPGVHYQADDGAGGGSGGSGSGGQQGQEQGGQGPSAGFQNLLQRNQGDAMAMANRLYDENYQLRQRNRELSGRVPAEGTVVLSGEQATAWQAYQQLGSAQELQQRLDAAQTATAELTTLRRSAQLSEVAQIAGYKPSVLTQLAGDREFEIREVETDGTKVKAAYVKDGEQLRPVAEYAQAAWADFMPALQASQGAGQQQAGTKFPAQQGGGQAPSGDVAGDLLKQFQQARDSQVNPLAPRQS